MLWENKKIVIDFFEMTFNQHLPRLASEKYIADEYIQHNPKTKDGARAFYTKFESFFIKYPQSSVDIRRVIAEDDMVVLHVLAKKSPQDRGEAVAEFFRLQSGKIVEHWDVVEAIPEYSENNNPIV